MLLVLSVVGEWMYIYLEDLALAVYREDGGTGNKP